MTHLQLQQIALSFAGDPVLREISLTVQSGSYVVLLGPSGCGKTSLLRIVAGLQQVDRGDVLFNDQSVVQLPPRKRDVAMVSQHDGLYPHQTVAQSMRLPLKGKLTSSEIDTRIDNAIRLTRIEAIVDRYPDRLSGGELRRAAIAKAIARGASVRLLDEPLSALDSPVRQALQDDLLKWHAEVPGTTIHVTHDGQEAIRMADQIAVMEGGTIIQFATPSNIYSHPASVTVAKAIGVTSMNLFAGAVRNGKVQSTDSALSIECGLDARFSDSDLWIGVRPESFRIRNAREPAGNHSVFHGRVDRIDRVGSVIELQFSSENGPVRANVQESFANPGDDVQLTVPADQLHLFDRRTGNRVSIESFVTAKR